MQKQAFDTATMLRFLFWAFAITWTFWSLAGMILSQGENIWGRLLQIPGAYGPTIAAYLATRPSRKEWLAQFKTRKKDWLYLAGACALSFFGYWLSSGNQPNLTLLWTFPLVVLAQTIVNGEEIGWRGYMQPRLIARFGLWKGIGLTAIVWSVWHLPLWFFNLRSDSFWLFVLSCAALSLCMAGIYKKTQSVLIFMVFHGFHNSTYLLFGGEISLTGELIYYALLAAYGLYLYYGHKRQAKSLK